MNRILLELAFLLNAEFHVLIHVISKEGYMRTHQNVHLQQHIKENIQTNQHIFIIDLSFYSGSV
jgi:hypothetical protein